MPGCGEGGRVGCLASGWFDFKLLAVMDLIVNVQHRQMETAAQRQHKNSRKWSVYLETLSIIRCKGQVDPGEPR